MDANMATLILASNLIKGLNGDKNATKSAIALAAFLSMAAQETAGEIIQQATTIAVKAFMQGVTDEDRSEKTAVMTAYVTKLSGDMIKEVGANSAGIHEMMTKHEEIIAAVKQN